ncbi:MAG: hypothetical protein LLP51_00290 [Halorhodospira halophila]|uniref:hypothetical protein n=1 Tax=Halorhodospira TaxID=85108 RepID=UPI001913E611|nr:MULTISPECIES: hypothetical protein [Halorhodospira]MBK5944146.1 hypothetical protein [Halorhodospira halophila]MCC3749819.1 hypothetical protein [Halorhodospira halophila]MCG5527735.1 hypothetical protein [Halorhodospira halophila]MCG5537777.1 hypothetical protein [Halorhodospira sp. 9622]MCG5542395.1 hypothetical protein [Halorhodospira sp. 9628]
MHRYRRPNRTPGSRHLAGLLIVAATLWPVLQATAEDAEAPAPHGSASADPGLLTEHQRSILDDALTRIEEAALRDDEAFLDELDELLSTYPRLADPIARHAMEMRPALMPGIMRILEQADGPEPPDTTRETPPTDRPAWWQGGIPGATHDETEEERAEEAETIRVAERAEEQAPPPRRNWSVGVGYGYHHLSVEERYGDDSTRLRAHGPVLDIQYAVSEHASVGIAHLHSEQLSTSGSLYADPEPKRWSATDLTLRFGREFREAGPRAYMGAGLHYERLERDNGDTLSGTGFHLLGGGGYAWERIELRLEASARSVDRDLVPDDFRGSRSSSLLATATLRGRF